MYEINFQSIEKKITSSAFSGNEDDNRAIKDSLLVLMKELCEYTYDVNRQLIFESGRCEDSNHIDVIYTTILPLDEELECESVGLYRMAENDATRVFLDCEYDEIRYIVGDLTEKKYYKGKYIKDGIEASFDYYLEFDRAFLVEHEKIFDYAEQYNVMNPIILSPYSHKSFFVKYDNDLNRDDIKLDFCFADNNIPVIQGDWCLYWNIRKSFETEKTYDAKEPYGDKTKYIFRFGKTKKGKYLLPLPNNNQTCIYDISFNEKGVDIIIDRDIEDFTVFEYFNLDMTSRIVKERQSKGMLFDNQVIGETKKHRRILSEGDIERAIGCFREWQEIHCYRTQGTGKHIVRYSKKYRADRKDKNLFNTSRREHICFKNNNRKFLNDYANFILEYLEYYYPEIEWAGEE